MFTRQVQCRAESFDSWRVFDNAGLVKHDPVSRMSFYLGLLHHLCNTRLAVTGSDRIEWQSLSAFLEPRASASATGSADPRLSRNLAAKQFIALQPCFAKESADR